MFPDESIPRWWRTLQEIFAGDDVPLYLITALALSLNKLSKRYRDYAENETFIKSLSSSSFAIRGIQYFQMPFTESAIPNEYLIFATTVSATALIYNIISKRIRDELYEELIDDKFFAMNNNDSADTQEITLAPDDTNEEEFGERLEIVKQEEDDEEEIIEIAGDLNEDFTVPELMSKLGYGGPTLQSDQPEAGSDSNNGVMAELFDLLGLNDREKIEFNDGGDDNKISVKTDDGKDLRIINVPVDDDDKGQDIPKVSVAKGVVDQDLKLNETDKNNLRSDAMQTQDNVDAGTPSGPDKKGETTKPSDSPPQGNADNAVGNNVVNADDGNKDAINNNVGNANDDLGEIEMVDDSKTDAFVDDNSSILNIDEVLGNTDKQDIQEAFGDAGDLVSNSEYTDVNSVENDNDNEDTNLQGFLNQDNAEPSPSKSKKIISLIDHGEKVFFEVSQYDRKSKRKQIKSMEGEMSITNRTVGPGGSNTGLLMKDDEEYQKSDLTSRGQSMMIGGPTSKDPDDDEDKPNVDYGKIGAGNSLFNPNTKDAVSVLTGINIETIPNQEIPTRKRLYEENHAFVLVATNPFDY